MSNLVNVSEQFSRQELLRKWREELRYARSMTCADWRYATIARMIEADIRRLTCGKGGANG